MNENNDEKTLIGISKSLSRNLGQFLKRGLFRDVRIIKEVTPLYDGEFSRWQHFLYVREEIRHEHDLLTARVSWFVTCQSFLLIAYASSYATVGHWNYFSNVMLPFIGVVVSILATYAIGGASLTIQMWQDLRSWIAEDNVVSSRLIARWEKGQTPQDDKIHRKSTLLPILLPALFSLMWLVNAIVTYWVPWMKPK